MHSKIQAEAVQTLLKDAQSLGAENKTTLARMVSEAGFCQSEEMLLLQTLSSQSLQPVKRRGQQDFTAFIYYLCENEWTSLLEYASNEEHTLELMINALVQRLHCLNPCQYTLKRLMSVALVLSKKTMQTPTQKKAYFKKVTEKYAKFKRRFNTWLKQDATRQLKPYVEKLPNSPSEFEQLEQVRNFGVERYKTGPYVQPQVDLDEIFSIEMSFKMKSTSDVNEDAMMVQPLISQGKFNPMQMMVEWFQNQMNPRSCNLSFTRPRRHRSLAEFDEDDSPPMRRCRTIDDFDGVSTPPSDRKIALEDAGCQNKNIARKPSTEKDDRENDTRPPSAESQDIAGESPPLALEDNKSATALLDALQERDKEKAELAKVKAMLAREQKKKLAAKAADPTEETEEVEAKGKGKGKGKKAKVKPCSPLSSEKKQKKREVVEFEKTRDHWLARTQGGSKSFKVADYSSKNHAEAEARKWFEKNKSS